jgi:hypothetical protein
MPVKSAKQFRLMEAAANGSAIGGPSEAVAKEMLAKTPHSVKSSFAKKKRGKFNPFEKGVR